MCHFHCFLSSLLRLSRGSHRSLEEAKRNNEEANKKRERERVKQKTTSFLYIHWNKLNNWRLKLSLAELERWGEIMEDRETGAGVKLREKKTKSGVENRILKTIVEITLEELTRKLLNIGDISALQLSIQFTKWRTCLIDPKTRRLLLYHRADFSL